MIERAAHHVYRLWGRWWVLPLFPTAYAIVMLAIGDLRPEHLAVAAVCATLAFANAGTKQFLIDVSPYLIVAFGYDLVRYARSAVLTADRVIGCELRQLELTLFPFADGVTPQDFFHTHHTLALDVLFAIPYTIFVYFAFIYAAYLFFVDRPRMRRYLWAFAIANYISFATWLILPAAPPWYIRAHGCAIDLSASPSAAALLRLDQHFDITYFETFYSRAASVFGAMPSMHCAYPMLGLLTAWRAASWKTRPLHILYAALMFFASVYLDHHWVVDGIAGWLVAAVAVYVSGRLMTLRDSRASAARESYSAELQA